MTTLGIIGGGIAGRSLIYALAKEKKTYTSIILFDSPEFAHTCSLRSTAVVASRGVSEGHSELGDLLLKSFQTFSAHVSEAAPSGIFSITQYTGALSRLDQFRVRYPGGRTDKTFGKLRLKNELYVAEDAAYLIDTQMYLDWLLSAAGGLPLKAVKEFVTKVEGKIIETVDGSKFEVDQLVFAGGVYNQYWDFKTPSKSVQGTYLEFKNVDFGPASFSATLESDNLIYHAHTKTLLMGSTSQETPHEWPQGLELRGLYQRLTDLVDLRIPLFESGVIITGLREKAPKRAPYLVSEGSRYRIGGFYKNGYSLSLHLSQRLASQLVLEAEE